MKYNLHLTFFAHSLLLSCSKFHSLIRVSQYHHPGHLLQYPTLVFAPVLVPHKLLNRHIVVRPLGRARHLRLLGLVFGRVRVAEDGLCGGDVLGDYLQWSVSVDVKVPAHARSLCQEIFAQEISAKGSLPIASRRYLPRGRMDSLFSTIGFGSGLSFAPFLASSATRSSLSL